MYLDRFKVIELPAPALVHWILNPGLAVSELVLGQRVAARTLVDQTADAPLFERIYLECRACSELHLSRLWAKSTFGNWFGIVCPKCEAKIPTLLNVFSILLLIPAAPVWFPLKLIFEKRLHQRQLARVRSAAASSHLPTVSVTGRQALRMAVYFAVLMFVLFAFIMPPIMRTDITLDRLILIAALCLAAGLGFGFFMRWSLNRNAKRS